MEISRRIRPDIMGISVPCMRWAPFIWGRILSLFTQTEAVDLPYDIIIDIFSRLPAQLIFQCCHSCRMIRTLTSSPTFVSIHLKRATSVVVIQRDPWRKSYSCRNGIYEDEVPLYFIDDKTKERIPKNMRVSHSCTGYTQLTLIGSCNGLLLFSNHVIVIIWNPITQEQIIVNKPDSVSTCGFFFDPKTREYIVLFWRHVDSGFHLMTYGLLRHTRKTTTLSHPPWFDAPVILKSTLHWLVDNERYKRANSRFLLCAESIISFDMDTETLHTMSCPGDKYGKRADNSYVHLLKKEECLCFFDTSSYRGMDFWVLQDYAEEVWTKTHVLNLELILPCRRPELQYIRSAPDIDNDELLLVWNWTLIRLNLQSNSLRKLKMRKPQDEGNIFYFVEHRDSLATLRTDDIVH